MRVARRFEWARVPGLVSMNPTDRKKPFPRKAERFFVFSGLLLVLFACAPPLSAYRILFYYNRLDGTHGGFLHCVNALRDAGHDVRAVDVGGEPRDPWMDDWGAYDQVWDMRYVDENKERCGSGDPKSADYFWGAWREKSADYLAHCGKLFVGGENYMLTDRDEGIYAFLKQTGAVLPGFSSCPPSRQGNSNTLGPETYKVMNGLGPSLFWGDEVGGIPLDTLTGTSFVQTKEDWQDNDRVDRSIASGWDADQLKGLAGPHCGKGKLFLVWDATMWSLWSPDFSSPQDRQDTYEPKRITLAFFRAAAQWLGGWDCNCGSRMPLPKEGRMTGTVRPTGTVRSTVKAGFLDVSAAKTPVLKSPFQSTLNPGPTGGGNPKENPSGPATLVFSAPPVNIYVRFADGMGRYQLTVQDAQGRLLKTLLDAPVTSGGESWASWDGTNLWGKGAGPGLYPAVLSKNGTRLRTLLLRWLPAP